MKNVAMQGTEDSGCKTSDTQKMRLYLLFFLFLKHAFFSTSSLPVTLVFAVGSEAKCLDQMMHLLCRLEIQEGLFSLHTAGVTPI